ncbi:DUF7693 family protein [Brevundimonas sp.]|uniref:DUF7693 family protein n=1 Tax=Brevundimonas sp. TaxID=1871086 RepID=UPI002D2E2CB9|nr:hypothetical protein [Brevundimonas sp.]HYD26939.1 hypothetical protein [Brevundimonas sp.]
MTDTWGYRPPPVTPAVSREEAVAQVRAMATGDVTFTLERSWADVFCGNVVARLANGWTVEIFNDCDDLDYVDVVVAPDGRRSTFEDWLGPDDGGRDRFWEASTCLSEGEYRQLLQALRG